MSFDQHGNLVLTIPPTSAGAVLTLMFLVIAGAYLIGYGRGTR